MSMAILTAKRVEPDETKVPHIASSIGIASADSVEDVYRGSTLVT